MRPASRRSLFLPVAIAASLLICAGLGAASLSRDELLADAYYHDKFFDRDLTFTLDGDEILVRYRPETTRQGVTGLERSLGLTVLHTRQPYHHHAHYRIPAGSGLFAVLEEMAGRSPVVSAYPVLVDQDGYPKYVVGHELTVRFQEGLDDEACRAILERMGSKVAEDHWTPGYYTITVPEGLTLFQAIRAYNDLQEVRFAEFSSVGYDDALFTPNDTQYTSQQNLNNTGQVGSCVCSPYGGHDINAPQAWDIERGDANVVVAVLDTGCDLDHPDLAANILPRGSEDWDFADPADSVPEDTAGHGTSCSGIVAAVTHNATGVAGIAHLCRIMPLRIDLSSGMNQNRADAINYAAGRRDEFLGMVLSNSWRMSSGVFTAVYDAIQYAKTNGCVVVFAAGNQNVSPVDVPADSAYCIAVGATSPCDERKSLTSCDGENFWGSSYGSDMDVMAPGVLIRTTAMGDTYTSTFNGTSSACPHVAAAAALLLSQNPTLTPTQVEEILETTAVDLGPAGFDNETAWGRIDLQAALNEVVARGTSCSDCESFDRYADTTTVPNWVEQAGNWTVSGRTLQPEAVGSIQWITRDGSARADGCLSGRATYGSGTGLRYIGLAARWNSASSYIMAKIQDNTGSGYFNAYYIYDSGTIKSSATGLNFGTDANIQLEFSGTALNLRVDTNRDGTWDYDYPATATKTSIGLSGASGYQQCRLDDWCLDAACDGSGIQVVDFDGAPSTYWYSDGNTNLGGYYSGLTFGPNATILEATVYGYNDSGYPYHSSDAVLFDAIGGSIRVDIAGGTDHVGLWYTSGSATGLELEAYNASDVLIGSVHGYYDYSGNDYLCLDVPGINHVLVHDSGGFFTIDDFEWRPVVVTDTISTAFSCIPGSGSLPFATTMVATLTNLYGGQFRRIAGRIDVDVAGGTHYGNWRSGFTNVGAGGSFVTTWNQNLPAVGALVGNNVFTLYGQDVTPSPYNQPPYPAAGDTDSDDCTVVGN